jgi:hypothetical protein
LGLRSSLTLEFYRKAYDHIVEHYPFWNRSSGRDQIWVMIYSLIFSSFQVNKLFSLPFPDTTEYFRVYANDSTLISEGSLFHGMKVLAMPLRRYGIA